MRSIRVIVALAFFFALIPIAYADWDPGDGYKMHFPQLPDYNPEWISIDVLGSNFVIEEGSVYHECITKSTDPVSMDLAFVINNTIIDTDGDGIPDADDNCPDTPNPDQEDLDQDGIGDVCDPDADGDGVPEDGDGSTVPGDNPCAGGATVGCDDNCPDVPNPDQEDFDSDGIGDPCDPDKDGDGVDEDGDGSTVPGDNPCAGGATVGCDDNCPDDYNPSQTDANANGIGDVCDDTDPCPGQFPGDANSDDDVDINDLLFLIELIYNNGPLPLTLANGDPNGDCMINRGDILYLRDYFAGGPAPVECTCEQPDPTKCCWGFTGNSDFDPNDEFDITDVVYSVNYLFKDGPAFICDDEADVIGSDGFDVSDVVYMVNYIFDDGPKFDICPY